MKTEIPVTAFPIARKRNKQKAKYETIKMMFSYSVYLTVLESLICVNYRMMLMRSNAYFHVGFINLTNIY